MQMNTAHKTILSLTGLIIIVFAIIVGWQWLQDMPIIITDKGAVNIKLSQDFNLYLNNSARFGDYVFTFKRLVSDSRCPEGVQCFTAGDAIAEIEIKKGDKIQTTEISLINEPVYIIDEYKLELISVAPYPKQGEEIDSEKYRVGLVLIKRGGVIP